eukprot:EG_transcript_6089
MPFGVPSGHPPAAPTAPLGARGPLQFVVVPVAVPVPVLAVSGAPPPQPPPRHVPAIPAPAPTPIPVTAPPSEEPAPYSQTNVYVARLPRTFTSGQLQQLFQPFGPIVSCRVMNNGNKRAALGFVQFMDADAAEAAVTEMNGQVVEGKKVLVRLADRDKDKGITNPPNERLYLANLPARYTEAELRRLLERYGTVLKLDLLPLLGGGQFNRRAMARFASVAEATRAKAALHCLALPGTELLLEVKFAEDTRDRQRRLAAKPGSAAPPSPAGFPTTEMASSSAAGSYTPSSSPIVTVGSPPSWVPPTPTAVYVSAPLPAPRSLPFLPGQAPRVQLPAGIFVSTPQPEPPTWKAEPAPKYISVPPPRPQPQPQPASKRTAAAAAPLPLSLPVTTCAPAVAVAAATSATANPSLPASAKGQVVSPSQFLSAAFSFLDFEPPSSPAGTGQITDSFWEPAPGSRLLLANLPPSVTKAHLWAICAAFGTVLDVSLNRTEEDTYLGTVLFRTAEASRAAAARLHGQSFQGRVLQARRSNAPNEATFLAGADADGEEGEGVGVAAV